MKTYFVLAASVGARRRQSYLGRGRCALSAASAFRSSAPRNHRTYGRVCPLNSAPVPGNRDEALLDRDGTREATFPRSVRDRVNDLTSHPAVMWDESSTFSSMHKKKLKRRHLPLFDRREEEGRTNGSDQTAENHDHLFDQFARAVCEAGVVARKEVFETWASALYIHSSFFGISATNQNYGREPDSRRVADIAAGHGLLAWALLLLDDEQQTRNREQSNGTTSQSPPLTAFCLDVQMPRSAELIQASMLHNFPQLEERFDYVEGRLEQLVPHPSCVLASVHACGMLSDIVVSTAAEHEVPLAVVPCCHSRKRKVLEVASPYAREMYEDIILNAKGEGVPDLAERLDGARMAALENAGMDVREAFLPSIFTGKNRLIMGFPGSSLGEPSPAKLSNNSPERRTVPARKGRMPPLNDDPARSGILPKRRFLKGFYVPCKDAEEDRRLVTELAGRAAAEGRKDAMHNRNHEASPQLDISLWLPEEDSDLTEDALSRIVESRHDVECTASKVGDVYVGPKGRRAQTFRLRYERRDGTVLPFEDAKGMHRELYDAVPGTFPGAECR